MYAVYSPGPEPVVTTAREYVDPDELQTYTRFMFPSPAATQISEHSDAEAKISPIVIHYE